MTFQGGTCGDAATGGQGEQGEQGEQGGQGEPEPSHAVTPTFVGVTIG